MRDTTWGRWVIGIIVAAAIVALLAWARNDPGVGGRDPDPPNAAALVGSDETAQGGAHRVE